MHYNSDNPIPRRRARENALIACAVGSGTSAAALAHALFGTIALELAAPIPLLLHISLRGVAGSAALLAAVAVLLPRAMRRGAGGARSSLLFIAFTLAACVLELVVVADSVGGDRDALLRDAGTALGGQGGWGGAAAAVAAGDGIVFGAAGSALVALLGR